MTKVSSLIFLNHLRNAPVGQDVSGVDEAVQHLGRLLDQVGLVGVVLQLVVGLQVEDHVQGLSVVGDLLVEASQVELVLDVILVNFTEKFISPQPAKPRDP